MIGNAVPVEFARILAEKIISDLKEYKNRTKRQHIRPAPLKPAYRQIAEELTLEMPSGLTLRYEKKRKHTTAVPISK